MGLVLFYRDALVAALRTFSAANNIVMAARPSGKIKATFQFIAINLVLIFMVADAWFAQRGAGLPLGDLKIDGTLLRQSGWWVMLLMACITAWSGVDYTLGARDVLRKLKI